MMKSSTPILTLIAALLAALFSLSGAVSARQGSNSPSTSAGDAVRVPLPKGKKLILKDGTFQLAREYTVEGDRVRYWSVERSQWEEIPAALIDWDATHKAEAQQSAEDAKLKAEIHASNLARLTEGIDVDISLEIKPGVFFRTAWASTRSTAAISST